MLFAVTFCSSYVFYCDIVYVRSAGIGRTGVLITMETAMCLIEANQPVCPLNIVRQMRDQRAMLIQTSVSLRSAYSLIRIYKITRDILLEVWL